MKAQWLLAVCVLGAGKFAGQADEPAKNPEEVKIQARAGLGIEPDISGAAPKAEAKIVRSERDFKTAFKDTALVLKLLKVNEVDFKESMVIHLYYTHVSSGGHRLEILRAEVADDTLVVHWKMHSPPADTPVAGIICAPGEVVVVKRFEGKVRFVRDK